MMPHMPPAVDAPALDTPIDFAFSPRLGSCVINSKIKIEALDYKKYFNFHSSQTQIVQERSFGRHREPEKVL